MLLRRVLAVLAASLVVAGCTSGGPAAKGTTSTTSATPTTTTTLPSVLTSVTPAGWVPVDYGDAQISVPGDWRIGYDVACLDLGPPGAIYLGNSGYGYCPFVAANSAPMVTVTRLARSASSSAASAGPPRIVNGIRVWGRIMPDGVGSWTVPELGVTIALYGARASRFLATLTRSPAAVVLAPGPAPTVPKSWRWVTGGTVKIAVPRGWAVVTSDTEDQVCGREIALPHPNALVLDSDRYPIPGVSVNCYVIPLAAPPVAPTNGVSVDLHPKAGIGWPPSTKLRRCLHLHGLTACLYDRTPTTTSDQMAELDILFVQVTVPGHAGHELLEIGLAGNGTVARTILYPLQAA